MMITTRPRRFAVKEFLTYGQNQVIWLNLFFALVFMAMYFLAAFPRLFYPYDLDFIEDGLLMESLSVANGQPLYVPPNAEYVPHLYMPLYSWLGGLLFKVTGQPGFLPLRAMSLLAVVLSAGLIYWIARRESGLSWVGITCAGLFLGGYRVSGFWYELARVDALLVALALAGLTLGIYGKGSKGSQVLAAICLALAFFTKQNSVIFGVGLALYLLVTIRHQAWIFLLTWGVLITVPALILNRLSQGWFFYYIFKIASTSAPLEIGRLIHFIYGELFGLMAGLSVMAIGAGLLGLRRTGSLWKVLQEKPWLILMGAAAIISGMVRASVGGNLNNLMSVYALLCLAPAVLMREWQNQPELLPSWRNSLITLMVLAQFALGVYNPPRYIPSLAMRQSGDRLIERIAAVDGEVLVLMHPYYAWLAGKKPSAQLAALWHARQRGTLPLPPDFVRRLQNHYYAAIISDNSSFETEPDIQQLITTYYVPATMLAANEAPATTTGVVVRPEVIYVPK